MKASIWLRRVSLSTLALLLALTGCESASDSGLLLEPKHEQEQVLISLQFGSGYRVVAETEESVGSVEAVIGTSGGVVALGKHVLSIPSGAVTAPTTFRIEKRDDDHARLHLSASRYADNDVGRLGFQKPVRLMMSYGNASNVSSQDAAQLRVMYIRPDQMVEVLPSSVNYYDRWVGTDLRHFSEYGIGWPNLTQTVTSTVGGLLF